MQLAGNRSMDLVRFGAAMLVVAHHVRYFTLAPWETVPHTPGNAVVYTPGSLGHPAVMVFFVLSGYWVGGSVIQAVREGRFSAGRYAVARLTRLWTVLIPAVLLTGVLGAVAVATMGDRTMFAAANAVFPYALADHLRPEIGLGNLLFVQSLVVPPFGNNGALWSVAYEFWFYVLFPPLALALSAGTPVARRAALLAVVAVALAVLGIEVAFGFVAWLVGAVLAWRGTAVRARLERWSPRRAVTARVLAFGMLGVVMCASPLLMPAFDVVVALAAAAALATLVTDPAMPRPLTAVSGCAAWSFSLYAIHMPLAAVLAAWLGPDVAARWAPTLPHLAAAAALWAVLLLAGWAFAQLTERHTARLRARLTAPRRRTPPPTVVVD